MLFSSDERNLYLVPKFANAHKNFLVIVMDPQTDRIFVSHRGVIVNGRIRSVKGRTTHIVRDVLKQSRFKFHIDEVLGTLAETLNVPIPKANQIYSFLDGAIFNIGKALAKKKGKKAALAPPGRILSPYQPAARE